MPVPKETKDEALKHLDKIRRLLNQTGDLIQGKKKESPANIRRRSRPGGK